MSVATHEELLDVVRRIGPIIGEHAEEGEHRRRLSKPVVDELRSAGLFRMLLPGSLGGLEVDPATFARVVEEVARHDSAAGWALQVNVGDWWGRRLPDAGVEEIYADGPDAVIAAAFQPPLDATPTDGGYLLTGRRPLASNIHDADWLMVTAVAGEDAFAAMVRADEVEILDSWYSLGMRSTDSNDVSLEDVFVPSERTFPLVPEAEPGTHYGGPLYRIPAMTVVAIFGAPVVLAIARQAIDEVRGLAIEKMSLGYSNALAHRPVAQGRLARAEGILRSARGLLYATIGEDWQRALAGETPTLEQRAEPLLAAAHATSSAVEAVDLAYSLAGSSGIYARNPIERHFRDIQTLRHHGFFNESRFEAVGQVMLGLEPEFAFVAF